MPVPFADFDMRLPPMGPTFEGNADGDVFAWNATTRKWNIVPGLIGATEFDFLISSRADLVAAVGAPVAGEFQLVAGSYFFKQEVDLDAGENIVADGVTVYIAGGGPVGSLDRGWNGNAGASTPAFICRNGANVRLFNVRIGAVTVSSHGILVTDSSLDIAWCDVPSSTGGSQPALELGTGSECNARNSSFGGAVAGVEITAGNHKFSHCEMQAGLTGDGLHVQLGAEDATLHVSHCYLAGSAAGGEALFCAGANLDAFFDDCQFDCREAANPGVVFAEMSSINILGGIVFGTSAGPAGDGITITGNVGGGIQICNVQGEFLDDFVVRTAGTQNRAVIVGCDTAGDVGTGVDWNVANIPTNGLLEVGNQFNTLQPFQNHAQTDARVNRKANSGQGFLAAETAIVP